MHVAVALEGPPGTSDLDTAASPVGWSPTTLHHVLLTVGNLGSQLIWSSEFAYSAPYLLHSLHLRPSTLSAVYVAGPLSGLVVQPLIGLVSDSQATAARRVALRRAARRLRAGSPALVSPHDATPRLPLLLAATLLSALGLVNLAWARDLVRLVGLDDATHMGLVRLLGVLGIFSIDFSINAVNALNRILLVDVVPSPSQSRANAWASRLSGAGAILGFLLGQADLPASWPFRHSFSFAKDATSALPQLVGIDGEEAQLKCISVVVISLLVLTQLITVLGVRHIARITEAAWTAADEAEHSLDEQEEPHSAAAAPPRNFLRTAVRLCCASAPRVWAASLRSLRALYAAYRRLPRTLHELFRIQLLCWTAWFPVLFYSSLWVGGIAQAASKETVTETVTEPTTTTTTTRGLVARHGLGPHVSGIGSAEASRVGSRALFYHAVVAVVASVVLPWFTEQGGTPPAWVARVAAWLRRGTTARRRYTNVAATADGLEGRDDVGAETTLGNAWPRVRLAALWAWTNAVLAVILFVSPPAKLVGWPRLASLLVALTGVPWAVANWAPFALIGVLLLRENGEHVSPASVGEEEGEETKGMAEQYEVMALMRDGRTRGAEEDSDEEGDAGSKDERRLASAEDAGGIAMRELSSQSGRPPPTRPPAWPEPPSPLESHSAAARGDGASGSAHRSSGSGSSGEPAALPPPPPPPPRRRPNVVSTKSRAGTVLGLHNIAIVLPQFGVTLVSTLLFALLEAHVGGGGGATAASGDGAAPSSVRAAMGTTSGGMANGTTTRTAVPGLSEADASANADGSASGAGVTAVQLLGAVAMAVATVLTMRLDARLGSMVVPSSTRASSSSSS